MRIGLVGTTGFIGNNLLEALRKEHEVHEITRENLDWAMTKMRSYNTVINAAGQAAKFQAEKDPIHDLRANIELLYQIKRNLEFDKFIHISSIDAYGDGIYGLHKGFAEDVVRRIMPKHTILRCGSVIGPGLKKGVVYDMINNLPIRVSSNSKLQLITTSAIAEAVNNSLKFNSGTVLCAGIPIFIEDMAKLLGREITEFGTDEQIYNVSGAAHPNIINLKTSEDYLKEFINERMEQPA